MVGRPQWTPSTHSLEKEAAPRVVCRLKVGNPYDPGRSVAPVPPAAMAADQSVGRHVARQPSFATRPSAGDGLKLGMRLIG